MSITMNRDQFVSFLHNYYINNRIDIKESLNLISEYCIEHCKNEDSIKNLIELLTKNTAIISSFLIDPIDYYEHKFNICKLYKNNRYEELINTGITSNKKVILIF